MTDPNKFLKYIGIALIIWGAFMLLTLDFLIGGISLAGGLILLKNLPIKFK